MDNLLADHGPYIHTSIEQNLPSLKPPLVTVGSGKVLFNHGNWKKRGLVAELSAGLQCLDSGMSMRLRTGSPHSCAGGHLSCSPTVCFCYNFGLQSNNLTLEHSLFSIDLCPNLFGYV